MTGRGYAIELFDVIGFENIGHFRLKLRFDDGLERVIDFEPILHGPLWGELRHSALFDQVALNRDTGTIEWPNGADIDPTVLHDWPDHVDYIVEKRKRWIPEAQEV